LCLFVYFLETLLLPYAHFPPHQLSHRLCHASQYFCSIRQRREVRTSTFRVRD
jgi:hypothetical protein